MFLRALILLLAKWTKSINQFLLFVKFNETDIKNITKKILK